MEQTAFVALDYLDQNGYGDLPSPRAARIKLAAAKEALISEACGLPVGDLATLVLEGTDFFTGTTCNRENVRAVCERAFATEIAEAAKLKK